MAYVMMCVLRVICDEVRVVMVCVECVRVVALYVSYVQRCSVHDVGYGMVRVACCVLQVVYCVMCVVCYVV